MPTVRGFGAAAMALALTAAACTDGDDPATSITGAAPTAVTTTTTEPTITPEPTTTTTEPVPPLVIWADQPLAHSLEGAGADFQAVTGIPVEIEVIEFQEIPRRIRTEGGGRPDVLVGHHTWVGELVADEVVAAVPIPVPDVYFHVALAAFTVGDRLYGLPYAVEGAALYRNTDISRQTPETFEELAADCETLADKVPTCLGIEAGSGRAHQAFIHAFGGYVFGYGESGFDPADVGLDTEGAQSGAFFIDTQVASGLLDPSLTDNAAEQRFLEGQAAYLWSGPEVAAAADAAGIAWAAIPFPTINGFRPIPFTDVRGFMINASSAQPEAAEQFVVGYLNDPNVMFDLSHAAFRGPAHRDTYADAVKVEPRLIPFSPVETEPRFLTPGIPQAAEVWGRLDAVIAAIYAQAYSEEAPDARAVLRKAAEELRAAVGGLAG